MFKSFDERKDGQDCAEEMNVHEHPRAVRACVMLTSLEQHQDDEARCDDGISGGHKAASRIVRQPLAQSREFTYPGVARPG